MFSPVRDALVKSTAPNLEAGAINLTTRATTSNFFSSFLGSLESSFLFFSFLIPPAAFSTMADNNPSSTSPLPPSSAEQLVRMSAKRTREMFAADFASISALDHTPNNVFSITPSTPASRDLADQIGISVRIRNEYEDVRELPPALAAKQANAAATAAERRKKAKQAAAAEGQPTDPKMRKMIEGATEKAEQKKSDASMALTLRAGGRGAAPNASGPTAQRNTPSSALVRRENLRQPRPEWHAPWKSELSGIMLRKDVDTYRSHACYQWSYGLGAIVSLSWN
jgi:hypothetical protein